VSAALSATPSYIAAQRALVRMYFDPAFAAAVRESPDAVLAHLPPPLRAQLAAVDDRALRLDRLRRRRALRTLSEEWKATTTWVLAETGRLATLEDFFSSAHFHAAVEERGSMPLAFAAFLAELIVARPLLTPHLADVLAIETALAQARREPDDDAAAQSPAPAPLDDDTPLRRAPGVIPLTVGSGAMAVLQQAERYLFEVGLMPAVALCDDAPGLSVDPKLVDAAPTWMVAVKTSSGVSLVTIERPLYEALRAAGPTPRRVRALVGDATARGLAAAAARAAVDELVRDELLVPA
jgi:hypothetical protein